MRKTLTIVIVAAILLLGGLALYRQTQKSKTSSTPSSNTVPTNSSQSGSSTSNAQDSSQAPTSDKVSIENMLFTPAQITVTKGTKVTWINNDSAAHTVTADKGAFDSGTIKPGASYSFTFNETGSFQYHCAFHSAMHGTVVVR